MNGQTPDLPLLSGAPRLLALPAPKRWRRYLPGRIRFGGVLAMAVLAAGLLGGQAANLHPVRAEIMPATPADLAQGFLQAKQGIGRLQVQTAANGQTVRLPADFSIRLSAARHEASLGDFALARRDLDSIQTDLSAWEAGLNRAAVMAAASPAPARFLPIVMYHEPPPDLAAQLQYLADHHYTSVSLDQVAAALSGGQPLPAKPVVITFDDGFASQVAALPLLQRYQMKAAFYIICGGPGSAYHIGANRRLPDPQGGPAYLSWDQIRSIDQNPLFTIGAHTINHLDLAEQTDGIQEREIMEGKAQLEHELGHPVHHFAYPYGAFNATTIQLVRQAGFYTAVSTQPGTDQAPGDIFTLHRIRSTLTLP